MSFVSYGITLAKYMVKEGEVIFFPSDKKLELTYFIDNYWENTRTISAT